MVVAVGVVVVVDVAVVCVLSGFSSVLDVRLVVMATVRMEHKMRFKLRVSTRNPQRFSKKTTRSMFRHFRRELVSRRRIDGMVHCSRRVCSRV